MASPRVRRPAGSDPVLDTFPFDQIARSGLPVSVPQRADAEIESGETVWIEQSIAWVIFPLATVKASPRTAARAELPLLSRRR